MKAIYPLKGCTAITKIVLIFLILWGICSGDQNPLRKSVTLAEDMDSTPSVIKTDSKLAAKMNMQGELTPLQRYDLTELKLVAIIVAGDNSKAMVEDSKGDGYIISKGTLIGDKYGEFEEIKSNEVVVIEKEVDPTTDEIISKEVSLILHKPEEEEL